MTRPEDQPDWPERLEEMQRGGGYHSPAENAALVREAKRVAYWRAEVKRADDERDVARDMRNDAIAAHRLAEMEWDEESDRLEGDREAALAEAERLKAKAVELHVWLNESGRECDALKAEVASLKEDVERRDMTNMLDEERKMAEANEKRFGLPPGSLTKFCSGDPFPCHCGNETQCRQQECVCRCHL